MIKSKCTFIKSKKLYKFKGTFESLRYSFTLFVENNLHDFSLGAFINSLKSMLTVACASSEYSSFGISEVILGKSSFDVKAKPFFQLMLLL